MTGACEECGNDDPTEGSRLCLDCLEAVSVTRTCPVHGPACVDCSWWDALILRVESDRDDPPTEREDWKR